MLLLAKFFEVIFFASCCFFRSVSGAFLPRLLACRDGLEGFQCCDLEGRCRDGPGPRNLTAGYREITPIRSGRFRNPKANHLGCIKPVNSGINCQPQLVQDFSYQQYLKTGKNIFWQTSCLASMLVFRVVLGHAWFYDFWNHHDLFFLQDPEEQVGKSWIHSIFCRTPNILNYPDIYQVVVSKICFLWPRYLGRWSNLTNMFFSQMGGWTTE